MSSPWDRFQPLGLLDEAPPICDDCEAEKCFKGCPLDKLEEENDAIRSKMEANWIASMEAEG